MNENIRNLNMALSQLYQKEDELYHRYSVYCGLSEPAVWVLYTLYEEEDRVYTQNDLAAMWCFPKQTLNYAVGGLVKNGWLRMEQLSGGRNRKALLLTEAGERICEEKILPLMLAEERSLLGLREEEREQLLRLYQKQCSAFEKEIERLTGEKNREV